MTRCTLYPLVTGLCATILIAGCGKSDKAPELTEEGPVTFAHVSELRLPIPGAGAAASDLGLDVKASEFALADVKCPVILLQLFDMYCRNCQKVAPDVNQLYEQVQASDIKDRVRFIGLGKGNTKTEVGIFRDRYDVAFPLFEDVAKINTKRLGESRTPYFLLLDMKNRRVVHQQWMLPPVAEFMAKIRQAAQ